MGGGVNPTGKVVDTVSNIASSLGPAGAIAGTALQLANGLLTNPSNYEPVRQNTVSGYNNGGPITPVSQESTAVQTTLPFNAADYYLPKQPRQSNPSFMNRLG